MRLRTALALLGLTLSGLAPRTAPAADAPAYARTEDVIYGRKYGTALTMDVFRPKAGGNGLGLIYAVSGGWYSAHESINPAFIEPLVSRGYTVFAVVHGSQPKFTIPEILADMNRAVRYVRRHAADYGVDPGRLGIYGASAGGHLSLMQGTAGDTGDPNAKDPVDRESSRVQAVACFFPPTDFLNYGKAGEHALGRGVLENFRAPFDFETLDPKRRAFVPVVDDAETLGIGRRISPVTHVSPDDPPSLIVHGDADKLVPIQQAELIVATLKKAGVDARLDVKPGAAHGWPDLVKDLTRFADWFDAHLKPADKNKAADARPAAGPGADRPPRKVVVGTAVFAPFGTYPGLDARLTELCGLVDEMARRAKDQYPGHGLDLAVLPESAVNPTTGPPSSRAVALAGPVAEAFGALARKHAAYIVAPMELAEDGPKGAVYSNTAVLFDRKGGVAGVYRKVHPVAGLNSDDLEGGITPGTEFPVFDCDFGRLGVQICWDVQFDEGWAALARKGAEVVAWPTASPATALPAMRAARHRYHVVSSTWREDATVFEPTGMVAAQVEGRRGVLVHELDLSYALLGWSAPLRNGKALAEKFGDKVGYHYSTREDLGLFWSNDPGTTVGSMIRALGLEEIDAQVDRNRRLYETPRRGPGG